MANSDDKYLKNYYRNQLINYQKQPVILSGKFKRIHDDHITFTTIRPYIRCVKTVTLCNHVNLYRPEVESVIDINTLEYNHKYYIIAHCLPYRDSDRMGIRLATEYSFVPIVRAKNPDVIPEEAFEICQEFNADEYARGIKNSDELI